jgi:alpha-1,3/alpha-1,6-mannosyltransferase
LKNGPQVITLATLIITEMADDIAVNSRFTQSIFKQSFPMIRKTPHVLYPAINLDNYDQIVETDDPRVSLLSSLIGDARVILSINRFERKKKIQLSIEAFALVKERNDDLSRDCVLVITGMLAFLCLGGHDPRVIENVEYLSELQHLVKSYSLSSHTIFPTTTNFPSTRPDVLFIASFSTPQRTYLLNTAEMLLYTPSNEHFGIVPVEAMYARVPVIAVDSGGPRESVVDSVTGFLVEEGVEGFADCVEKILGMGVDEREAMGREGRKRVVDCFGLDAFTKGLEDILEGVVDERGGEGSWTFYMSLAVVTGMLSIVAFLL